MIDAAAFLRLPRASATPPGIVIGPVDDIGRGAVRSYVVDLGDARFHGLIWRRDDEVAGFVDRCPHAGLPLARQIDDYLSPDGSLIVCAWHGALFDWSGACVGGPAGGSRLAQWPVAVRDGMLVTT